MKFRLKEIKEGKLCELKGQSMIQVEEIKKLETRELLQ